MSSNYRAYKVAICGGLRTGKSSLCARLTDRELDSEYTTTIGVDLMITYFTSWRTKLQFWDLAGDKRFDAVTMAYIPGAKLVLYVYDPTNEDSVFRMEELHSRYVDMGFEHSGFVIATHSDKDGQLWKETGEKFAIEHNFPHFTVSNTTRDGINTLLKKIVNFTIPQEVMHPPPPLPPKMRACTWIDHKGRMSCNIM